MEMTIAFVLLSFIATIGYLANKLIDRKYGTKPNEKILDEINHIKAFNKDRAENLENIQSELNNLKSSTVSELKAMSSRIDGHMIGKVFNIKKEEVKSL
jgi:hypothetical protein